MKAVWASAVLFFVSLTFISKSTVENFNVGPFSEVTVFRPARASEKLAIFLTQQADDSRLLNKISKELAKQKVTTVIADFPQTQGSIKCIDLNRELLALSSAIAHRYKLPVDPVTVLVATAGTEEFAKLAIEKSGHGQFAGLIVGTEGKSADPAGKITGLRACEPFTANRLNSLDYTMIQGGRLPANANPSTIPMIHIPVLMNGNLSETSKGDSLKTIATAMDALFSRTERSPFFERMVRARVDQLELIEATPERVASDELVIIFSGDGGWSDFSDVLANQVIKSGRAAIGINLIPYFWEKKSPEEIAKDIEAIGRVYLKKWNLKTLRLVGFSHGADILPFAVNQLGQETIKKLNAVALISPSLTTEFEFSLASWFYDSDSGQSTEVEARKLMHERIQLACLFGEDESSSSLCPRLIGPTFKSYQLPGGHHLDYDLETTARHVLNFD